MNKANILKLHEKLESEVAHLRSVAEAVAAVQGTGSTRLTNFLHEQVAVAGWNEWERFCEQLFSAYLNRFGTAPFNVARGSDLPGDVSLPVAEAVLSGVIRIGAFNDNKGLAKRLLARNPFDEVRDPDRRRLDDLRIIRNHIVHRNVGSRRAYRKRFGKSDKNGKLVKGTLKHPSTHLRARDGAGPRVLRYLDAIATASAAMRSVATT